jgi:hypothetical protein
MDRKNLVLLIIATVVATTFALVTIATMAAMMFGFSFGGEAAEPPTPARTLVPTWTATPTVVPSPTDTPTPTETPTPTTPPETPTPTQPPTATPGPPTSTPTPRPPAPTPTPRPPAPTNTPQPVYQYYHVSGPKKDSCHPGYCLPEISGEVQDSQGSPVDNFNAVWLRLESQAFGLEWCRTGDPAKTLQAGLFKFQSQGLVFGDYTLTVFDAQGGRPLSAPLEQGMSAYTRAQQSNIIFRKY